MGFFDKKFCDICGDKIGLLGNRKLEDGNLCKKCAAKLSPWFSERRNSTVEEIKEQLAYREENREAVNVFNTTKSLGAYTKVLVDEDQGKFMVTSESSLLEAIPDVIDLSQITAVRTDIEESETEEKTKDKDGKMVSYMPRRFKYAYNFFVTLDVNHPYFDEIRFRVNSGSVSTGNRRARAGFTTRDLSMREFEKYDKMTQEIKAYLETARFGQGQAGTKAAGAAAAAEAPVKKVCPCCGAVTFPDANGCCEYCGSPL